MQGDTTKKVGQSQGERECDKENNQVGVQEFPPCISQRGKTMRWCDETREKQFIPQEITRSKENAQPHKGGHYTTRNARLLGQPITE